MEIDEVKNVHDNHILKIGFNDKVKPPITPRTSITKLNKGCMETMKQRFKPEVKLRKSQKHKVCNGDTSDKLAVKQLIKMMGKMLQV